jgi:outer membrane protein assembly factor BamB
VWTLLALLAAPLAADEPDAAIAPAARWTDVRGTAAGLRRSAARPVVTGVKEAWNVELPGAADQPPLLWDGLAYLVCAQGAERTLIAVDIHVGERVASKDLGEFPPTRPIVWNGVVILNRRDHLIGYRRSKRTFRQAWKSATGSYTDPVVWDGEIYVVQAEKLEKYRVGRPKPVWIRGHSLRGPPAVFGQVVYASGHEDVPGYYPFIHIYGFDRRTGNPFTRGRVAQYATEADRLPGPDRTIELTIGEDFAYVRPPRPMGNAKEPFAYARVEHLRKGETVTFGRVGLIAADVPPTGVPGGALVRTTEKGVMTWEKRTAEHYHPVANSRRNPDLLARRIPAVSLGDVCYFGSWAADIATGDVLWRLPPEVTVTRPVVPADGLVLVLDGPQVLRAFAPRRAR